MSKGRDSRGRSPRNAASEAARQQSLWAYLRQRPNWATDLMFVVPVLLLYQVGTFLTAQRNGVDWVTTVVFRLRAHSEQAFLLLSAVMLAALFGIYLHLRRRQRFQLRMLGPVLLESGAYAFLMGNVIVLVMTQLLGIQPPSVACGMLGDPAAAAATTGSFAPCAVEGRMSASMVLFISAGAGLHEELVFRVLLFGGLLALLRRGLSLGPGPSLVIALAVSAALFSYAHHLPPHGEPFTTFAFVFRLLAGVVFGILYHLRGFATAVYTHFFYDVLVLGVWA